MAHQISQLQCFSSRLAVVFVQSIDARCYVENEDVVGEAPTSANTTKLRPHQSSFGELARCSVIPFRKKQPNANLAWFFSVCLCIAMVIWMDGLPLNMIPWVNKMCIHQCQWQKWISVYPMRGLYIQWNLSVTTSSIIKFIACDLFSNVF